MKRTFTVIQTGTLLPLIFLAACSKKEKPGPTIRTDTLTQSSYTISSSGTSPEATVLCSPYPSSSHALSEEPGLLLVMDQDGKVLQKQTTPGVAFCFNRWVINNQVRYTYLVNDPLAYRDGGSSNFAGYAVIADSALHEMKRVNFIPAGPGPYQAGQSLDVHDFILLSDDHYIALTYYSKNVTNIPAYLSPSPNVRVFAPIIQEVDKGAVVWQWDASSDTSFYANSVEENRFSDSTVIQDYMHMNAMYVDPRDNGLICSFRNQDQIIKIDRKTGAVLWRLGGKNSSFPLFSDQVFLRQHNVTLTDNNQTLLVFDNGEATLRPETRILEFKLDETNKKITSFKSFTVPEPFTAYMGSVQKNGPEYFIGGGTANYMLEINYVTGVKVKEFQGGGNSTYRAYSYPAVAN